MAEVRLAYISRNDLKSRLGITDTTDDAILDAVIQAASRKIDQHTGRTFRTETATRYYTSEAEDRLILDDDLLAVTSLKTDHDGDRTYEKTWSATDYDLEPFNAPAREQPYTRISQAPKGTQFFPANLAKSVEIVGSWGYWSKTESTTTANEAIDASETAIDVTSGAALKVLDTILIDSEQMFVTAISSNTITVVRGVNGTTAATHNTATAITRYVYPEPVVEACALLAVRLMKRKDSPFGVAGSADMGVISIIPRMDPDVRLLLAPYQKMTAGVV